MSCNLQEIYEATQVLHVVKFSRVYAIREIFNEKISNDVTSQIFKMVDNWNMFTRLNMLDHVKLHQFVGQTNWIDLLDRVNCKTPLSSKHLQVYAVLRCEVRQCILL